ncbi:hypothetical protein PG990_013847 [Apiospora arundinis]
MPLVLRYHIATIRDGAVLNSDNSNTLSGVAKSTATGIITTASTTPIPSDRTNTSFLYRVDLTPPEISWFDSQASWPLALIPLVITMLLTICLVAVSGSRRERIPGIRNPANERVLRQMQRDYRREQDARSRQDGNIRSYDQPFPGKAKKGTGMLAEECSVENVWAWATIF